MRGAGIAGIGGRKAKEKGRDRGQFRSSQCLYKLYDEEYTNKYQHKHCHYFKLHLNSINFVKMCQNSKHLKYK